MPPGTSLVSTANLLVRSGRHFRLELGALERRVAAEAGLTPAEAQATGELMQPKPLGMHDLARSMRIRRSTATRLVDQLERKGWVRRRAEASDRRRVRLELLPAGRERAEDFEQRLVQATVELLLLLPPEQRSLDLSSLEALNEALERQNDRQED